MMRAYQMPRRRGALAVAWVLALALPAVQFPEAAAQDAAGPAGAQDIQPPENPYADRSDWTGFSRGAQNISIVLFRDRDRDGIYDLGDRPLPAIWVEMAGPNEKRAYTRSNLNGFTNFAMSLFVPEAHITIPGEYRFSVLVPDGWRVTTGNAVQTNRFSIFEGTIGDFVAAVTFEPVGLSPDLTISGRIAGRAADGALTPAGGAEMVAYPPAGDAVEVAVDPQGRFSVPATLGTWRLVARGQDGQVVEREITVRDVPVVVSTLVTGDEPPPSAPYVRTIDFENLSGSALVEVPSGVGGLRWNNLVAVDFILYNGEGYMNTSMSGRYVAYNSSGQPVTFWQDEPFDFAGAYFGVAWMQAQGETLSIRAWRGGALVADQRLRLSALGPVWFDADFRGVDRVMMATEHYWQFVTDDLVVRTLKPANPQ
jgi:hypothetical protein